MKDAILGSALWSLGSNAHEHKLVHDYLSGMSQAPDISPAVKQALATALAGKPNESGGKAAGNTGDVEPAR